MALNWCLTPDGTGPAIVLTKSGVPTRTDLPVGSQITNSTTGVVYAWNGTSWVAQGAVPGGSSGQIQYNSSGVFGGFTMSGDVTVNTGTGVSAIGANKVTDAMLRQSAGLSTIGRSANSTGNVADITAGTDGHVLRRSGTTLGFGQVATAGVADDAITYVKMQNASAGNVVLARAASSSGDYSEVALSASQLLGRGSSGDVAAITLGAGLSISGTTLNATGAVAGAGAMVFIAEATPSGTGVVSFTSIAATWRDLVVVVRGRGTAIATSVTVAMQLNADTGANYDRIDWEVASPTAAFGQVLANTSIAIGYLAGANSAANAADAIRAQLYDYRGTTFQKAVTAQSTLKLGTASGNLFQVSTSGWWRSTAAVTQLDVFLSSGNFAAGSSVTLYGIY